MSQIERSSFGAFAEKESRFAATSAAAGTLPLPHRTACALVAALLTLFTTQLIDLAVFGGKPAFSNVGFLTMNLWPLVIFGLIGALTRKPWIIAIVLTIAGLGFAVSAVGFSHGFDRRAMAQYFMYGTIFLWNALFYVILCNTVKSIREDRTN